MHQNMVVFQKITTTKHLNQNKMKTAVEWLVEELTKNGHNFKLYKKEVEQAKEMEKERIKNAYNYAYTKGWNDEKSEYPSESEQYYNEIFKSE